VNRQAGQAKSVQDENSKQAGADGEKADKRADPEVLAERESGWKAVATELAVLDPGHNQGGIAVRTKILPSRTLKPEGVIEEMPA